MAKKRGMLLMTMRKIAMSKKTPPKERKAMKKRYNAALRKIKVNF